MPDMYGSERRRALPEWLGLIILGLGVAAIEQWLSESVAGLVSGDLRQRVTRSGPWFGGVLAVMAMGGLVLVDEKLRRILAEEKTSRTIERSRLGGARAFAMGFGVFILAFTGGLQVLLWLSAHGWSNAVVGTVAFVAIIVGIAAVARGVERIEKRARGDLDTTRQRLWLMALPGPILDGLLGLWTATGLGVTWIAFITADLAIPDPAFAKIAATAGGVGLFFVLFHLPWRHPHHLFASVRAGRARPFIREIGGIVGLFALVFTPHVWRAFDEAPLHRAASRGELAALQGLETEGRDLGAPLAGGLTVLHLAAGAGHLDVVEYLLTRPRVERDGRAETRHPTPLRMALEARHAAVALALLAAGADPERKGRRDRRPLHVATAEGLGDVVAALIARGVALDVPDRLGDTAMHLAAGKPEIYLQLQAAGASSQIPNLAGKTAAELREKWRRAR